uniref:Uncharacterized protein n=1 Tax=Arundo donax TaxID=35708 RepID=A0A0A8YDV5_ARUDO
MVLPLTRHRRRTLPRRCRVPPPAPPRPLPAPAQGPPPPLRRVGRRHRPDVWHRPVHGPGARAPGPQPRPRRPRPRQAPGHLRHDYRHPRRADEDGGVRPRPHLHR